jgi:hypothetical protein
LGHGGIKLKAGGRWLVGWAGGEQQPAGALALALALSLALPTRRGRSAGWRERVCGARGRRSLHPGLGGSQSRLQPPPEPAGGMTSYHVPFGGGVTRARRASPSPRVNAAIGLGPYAGDRDRSAAFHHGFSSGKGKGITCRFLPCSLGESPARYKSSPSGGPRWPRFRRNWESSAHTANCQLQHMASQVLLRRA